jgi:hypothetical protein
LEYKVNISIDDISPHPNASIEVLERCYKILGEIPSAKFTLFVPMGYYRTMPSPPESMCSAPLELQNFPDFCHALRGLDPNTFEIGYHGVLHGIPGKSNNDEFKSLSYSEAVDRIGVMFEISKLAGLDQVIKPIFRPPAYRMSPEAIVAARDMGIKIFGLSPDSPIKEQYGGEDEKKKDVVYYNSSPPIVPLKLEENTEIVYHACNWDKNYLNNEQAENLIHFIKKDIDKIDFCFIGDLL